MNNDASHSSAVDYESTQQLRWIALILVSVGILACVGWKFGIYTPSLPSLGEGMMLLGVGMMFSDAFRSLQHRSAS